MKRPRVKVSVPTNMEDLLKSGEIPAQATEDWDNFVEIYLDEVTVDLEDQFHWLGMDAVGDDRPGAEPTARAEETGEDVLNDMTERVRTNRAEYILRSLGQMNPSGQMNPEKD